MRDASKRFLVSQDAQGIVAVMDFDEVAWMGLDDVRGPPVLAILYKGNSTQQRITYADAKPARDAIRLFHEYVCSTGPKT